MSRDSRGRRAAGEIEAVDPTLIVTDVAPVAQVLERTLVREKLLARLSALFGFLAAALAAIGLYGLPAFAVVSRTRDLGVRMPLGADRGRVLRMEIWSALMEIWSALRLVAIGIAIGIPAAIAAGRYLSPQLFGVTAGDPVTLVACAALLTFIAVLAAWGPARRASRVHPVLALRSE